MALDTLVAGAYTNTFNGAAVGLAAEGYDLQQEVKGEEVRGDYYGESLIDGVVRGANVFLEYENIAYKAGSLAPFWPFGTLGEHPTPGQLMSDLAKQTVLTVTSGTPAATYGPASLTASKSMLAIGANSRLKFQSMLRRLPIRLQLIPYISSVVRWYQLS